MGSANPYQNTASTGSSPNCSRAPDRSPFHSNQPAHDLHEPEDERSAQQHHEDRV